MSEERSLGVEDLRFINLVAARRFGRGGQHLQAVRVEDLPPDASGSPFLRAASLAHALLRQRLFDDAPLATALLVMCAQLARDGLQLLAPQGAVVGMISELASGSIDAASLARWLEDRAVPATSGA